MSSAVKKLQTNLKQSDTLQLLSPQLRENLKNFSWWKQLERYDRDGLVNPSLLVIVAEFSFWYEHFYQRRWYHRLRLVVDYVAALGLVAICLPIFLLATLAIKIESKGPVFFRQVRIGKYARPFHIYKFRTMYEGSERRRHFVKNEMKSGLFKMAEDPRVTRVGRLLRKTSIDELPQLINILKGDMALIGPRPFPPEDTAVIPNDCFARFSALPGITGLWQAYHRESEDGLMKLKLDAEYVQRQSAILDIKIFFKTIHTVFTGKGAG